MASSTKGVMQIGEITRPGFPHTAGFMGIVFIETGYVGVVSRFGRYNRELPPGFGTYNVFAENVTLVFLGQVINPVHVSTFTAQQQQIQLEARLIASVEPTNIEKFLTGCADATGHSISSAQQALMSEVRGMSNIEDVMQNLPGIASRACVTLRSVLSTFGVHVHNLVIDEVRVSETVRKAMDNAVAAQRELIAQKCITDAERYRMVEMAKAEAEKAELHAQGIANARRVLVHGIHESATDLKNCGVTTQELMQFLLNQEAFDVERAYAHGTATVIRGGGGDPIMNAAMALARVTSNVPRIEAAKSAIE